MRRRIRGGREEAKEDEGREGRRGDKVRKLRSKRIVGDMKGGREGNVCLCEGGWRKKGGGAELRY